MAQIAPNLIPLEISDDQKRIITLTNVVKMLSNRGYIDINKIDLISKEFKNRTEEDIYKVKLDVKIDTHGSVYIKFLNQKVSAMGKNSILTNFLQNYEKSKMILLVNSINNKINNTIYSNYPGIEIFTINEMLINRVDHILVPQHILLSEEESQEVLDEYDARKKDMPKILESDAIARYYNMPVGRICKIIRNSQTSGECVYYRLVIKDHT